jgi:hypothetical protein
MTQNVGKLLIATVTKVVCWRVLVPCLVEEDMKRRYRALLWYRLRFLIGLLVLILFLLFLFLPLNVTLADCAFFSAQVRAVTSEVFYVMRTARTYLLRKVLFEQVGLERVFPALRSRRTGGCRRGGMYGVGVVFCETKQSTVGSEIYVLVRLRKYFARHDLRCLVKVGVVQVCLEIWSADRVRLGVVFGRRKHALPMGVSDVSDSYGVTLCTRTTNKLRHVLLGSGWFVVDDHVDAVYHTNDLYAHVVEPEVRWERRIRT